MQEKGVVEKLKSSYRFVDLVFGTHNITSLPKLIDDVYKYQPFDRQIWQRGYYEHIIRNDREYQKIYEYIENNPVKWEEDKYYNSI